MYDLADESFWISRYVDTPLIRLEEQLIEVCAKGQLWRLELILQYTAVNVHLARYYPLKIARLNHRTQIIEYLSQWEEHSESNTHSEDEDPLSGGSPSEVVWVDERNPSSLYCTYIMYDDETYTKDLRTGLRINKSDIMDYYGGDSGWW